jgi:hypothetical protein
MTRFAQRIQRLETRWNQEVERSMHALPDAELEAIAREDYTAMQRFLHAVWCRVWPNASMKSPEPQPTELEEQRP